MMCFAFSCLSCGSSRNRNKNKNKYLIDLMGFPQPKKWVFIHPIWSQFYLIYSVCSKSPPEDAQDLILYDLEDFVVVERNRIHLKKKSLRESPSLTNCEQKSLERVISERRISTKQKKLCVMCKNLKWRVEGKTD